MDGEKFPTHCGDLDIELLAQFAPRRLEIRLGGFELTAGELPEPPVSLVQRSAADQKSSFLLNYSSEDADS